MRIKTRVALIALPIVILVTVLIVLSQGHTFAILDTRGTIAQQEKTLLIIAFALSLLVIVPVYILTIFIIWKYRAGNTKASYQPNWGHNRQLETVWWGIPCVIILALSVVTWQSSHNLDPSRAISSTTAPMQVQVVALQWKWLFIYPEQGIASVNDLHIPINTPIQFSVTSDAPMNSFWIPQLGGQIYAMSGMTTTLHVEADTAGSYAGSSANMSGKGFSGMRFITTATSQSDFTRWTEQAKQSSTMLDQSAYDVLAQPTTDNVPAIFASVDQSLYDTIVMKYMSQHAHSEQGVTSAR